MKDKKGRIMAAVFRRFDIIEQYNKKDTWWNANMRE